MFMPIITKIIITSWLNTTTQNPFHPEFHHIASRSLIGFRCVHSCF